MSRSSLDIIEALLAAGADPAPAADIVHDRSMTVVIPMPSVRCARSRQIITGTRYRCNDARLVRRIGLSICEEEYLKLDDDEKRGCAANLRAAWLNPKADMAAPRGQV